MPQNNNHHHLPERSQSRPPPRPTRRFVILVLLLFILSPTTFKAPALVKADTLSSATLAVDSAYPAVVPDRQYWGTFYYPWYGDGELPPLTFTKDNNTSPLLGHTEPEVIRVNQTFYLYYRTDSSIAVINSTNGTDLNEPRHNPHRCRPK